MSYVITAVLCFLSGTGSGAYLHYKFGSKLASIEAKVRSVV